MEVFDISFQAFWGRPLGSTIREEITSCRGIPWPVKDKSHGLIGISIIFIIHFNRDTPIFWNTQINTIILKSSLFEGLLICSEPPRKKKKKKHRGEHRISMIANLSTCFAEKSLNAKWWDFGIILGKLELPAAQRIRIADQIFSLCNIMRICIRQ